MQIWTAGSNIMQHKRRTCVKPSTSLERRRQVANGRPLAPCNRASGNAQVIEARNKHLARGLKSSCLMLALTTDQIRTMECEHEGSAIQASKATNKWAEFVPVGVSFVLLPEIEVILELKIKCPQLCTRRQELSQKGNMSRVLSGPSTWWPKLVNLKAATPSGES